MSYPPQLELSQRTSPFSVLFPQELSVSRERTLSPASYIDHFSQETCLIQGLAAVSGAGKPDRQCLCQGINLRFSNHQRRRHDDNVSSHPDHRAGGENSIGQGFAEFAGLMAFSIHDQPPVRCPPSGPFPVRHRSFRVSACSALSEVINSSPRANALPGQILTERDIQCCECRSTADRMAGVGIAHGQWHRRDRFP